jgi:hypothetical protein
VSPSLTTAGTLAVNVSVPAIVGPPCLTGVFLSAQAVILDPCGQGLNVAPGPFLLSQAITAEF